MRNLVLIATAAMLLASCKEFEIASTDVPRDIMTVFNAHYPSEKNVS